MCSILLVTEDRNFAIEIKDIFSDQDHQLKFCLDASNILGNLLSADSDLLLIDIDSIPDSPSELLKFISMNFTFCKIIALTNNCSISNVTNLYASGVSMVHSKPLIDKLLFAQIDSLVAKTNSYASFTVQNISFKLKDSMLCIGDENILLTRNECLFLKALFTKNDLLKRDEVITLLERRKIGSEASIDTMVSRLRKKIGIDFIETVFGLGYRVKT